MKKIKLFFGVCLLSISTLLLSVYASDKTSADKNVTTANNNAANEINELQAVNPEEICVYDFESGYAKYLKKYDDNGNGGYRKDNNCHMDKLSIECDNQNYICWFRIPDDADAKARILGYKEELSNTRFENKQMLEEYLDSLLIGDVMNLYICADDCANYQVGEGAAYAKSYIAE